jgi:hypothetical protein
MDAESDTKRLRMTHTYLHEEYERMNNANFSIQATTENLGKTNRTYQSNYA